MQAALHKITRAEKKLPMLVASGTFLAASTKDVRSKPPVFLCGAAFKQSSYSIYFPFLCIRISDLMIRWLSRYASTAPRLPTMAPARISVK